MNTPDFSDRTYTAEVLAINKNSEVALKAILRQSQDPTIDFHVEESSGRKIKIHHAYISSEVRFGRSTRIVNIEGKKQVEIPRRQTYRGKEMFLYDVLIAESGKHFALAVPFHELAETFFVQVDRALVGNGVKYEKIDIRKLVKRLGIEGATEIPDKDPENIISLCATRCHLAYNYADGRVENLKQIQMTGANIGQSAEYKSLIASIVKPNAYPDFEVTPIVLGVALCVNGVKKSSATTDQHGNFKLWIAPGLRRLTRLFDLLKAIEKIEEVASTTSNVPILLSKTIRNAGG